jgi:hypothetical protein
MMDAEAAEPSVTQPVLSWTRSDPERRLGVPAGRYCQVNQFLTLIAGTLVTIALYAALSFVPETIVAQSLTQRGPVPYAIVLFAAWALATLLVKHLKLRLQRRALRLPLVPSDPTFVLSPATVDHVVERMFELVDDPRHFVLFNRIQIALGNLKNMKRIGDVRDVLDSQADNDEATSESSYSIVRGLIWAVPVLGFIGTVLGLSAAIGSFSSVLTASTDIEQLKPALRQVTGGLSVAFETTLHGLLAALAIHLLLTFLKRNEERFLDDCQEYCQRQIVGRLRFSGEQEG